MFLADKIEKIIKAQAGVCYITGLPGSGKSAVMEAVAKKNGWGFVDLRLSQRDSSEVIGIPTKQEYKGESVMAYCPPKWAVMANEKPTLIFCDELNRAPIDVRNAALQMLNERRLDQHTFNGDVFFAAAGNNDKEDGIAINCEVEELDDALNNRLIHIEWNMEFAEWKKNFATANVHPAVVSFLEVNPSYVNRKNPEDKAYASYRSWSNLSKFLIANFGKESRPQEVLSDVREFGKHYVGSSITAFIRYLEDLSTLTIKDILDRYDQVEKQVKKIKRDKVSELINELEKIDIQKLEKEQAENLNKFIKIIDEDERAAFFKNLVASTNVDKLEGNIKYLLKSNKEFLKTIQGLL